MKCCGDASGTWQSANPKERGVTSASERATGKTIISGKRRRQRGDLLRLGGAREEAKVPASYAR